ncbi:MAG: pilus assembly protein PilM [Patescibacteria group bacterium]
MLNPLSNAFGLDISDRSYKLAQLKKARGSSKYYLTALGSIEVPEGIMDQGNIIDQERAAALVRELIKNTVGRVKGRGVVACLPEAKTFIKIIDAPSGTTRREDLDQAVLKEIEQNIPLAKDEIYYDWQLVRGDEMVKSLQVKPEQTADETASAEQAKKGIPEINVTEEKNSELPPNEPEENKILLGAAPKQMVDEYSAMLDTAGLAPIAFEIEATAISRSVVPHTNSLSDAVGILDIGATRSSLVIYDRGMIQMSISIPVAGTSITKTISEKLRVGTEDAETLKIECGLDSTRCEDRIWTILQPLIDDMVQKIRNALRFYKIGFPYGKNIEHLYVCGGGAQFREIDSVLSRKLTIKVDRADSMINLQQPIPRKFRRESSLIYTTAIGLAIRAADESSRSMSRLR